MTFAKDAVARVTGYLKNYDTAEVSEILADIIHYCKEHNIDLPDQMLTAETYVIEEDSVDAG